MINRPPLKDFRFSEINLTIYPYYSPIFRTPVYSPPQDRSRSVTPQMETLAEYEENRVDPEDEG
jgi:hypothetical protein